MPTWIAPRLPPPVNTKAVFAAAMPHPAPRCSAAVFKIARGRETNNGVILLCPLGQGAGEFFYAAKRREVKGEAGALGLGAGVAATADRSLMRGLNRHDQGR